MNPFEAYIPACSPSLPSRAGSWRNGGIGDADWEQYNSQLTAEWLRFYERMAACLNDRAPRRPPIGWRDKQCRQFRVLLKSRYDGQSEPDPKWIAEYRRRLEEKRPPEELALFEDTWREHRGEQSMPTEDRWADWGNP